MQHEKSVLESLRRINYSEVIDAIITYPGNDEEPKNYEPIALLKELQSAVTKGEPLKLPSATIVVFTQLSSYQIVISKNYITTMVRSTNFKIGKGQNAHLMVLPRIVNPSKSLAFRDGDELTEVKAEEFEKAIVEGKLEQFTPSPDVTCKYIFETVSGNYFQLIDSEDYSSLLAPPAPPRRSSRGKQSTPKMSRVISNTSKSVYFIIKKNGEYVSVYNDTVKDPEAEIVFKGFDTLANINAKLEFYKNSEQQK